MTDSSWGRFRERMQRLTGETDDAGDEPTEPGSRWFDVPSDTTSETDDASDEPSDDPLGSVRRWVRWAPAAFAVFAVGYAVLPGLLGGGDEPAAAPPPSASAHDANLAVAAEALAVLDLAPAWRQVPGCAPGTASERTVVASPMSWDAAVDRIAAEGAQVAVTDADGFDQASVVTGWGRMELVADGAGVVVTVTTDCAPTQ